MASRPRARAASISSRYGPHALAAGARPGGRDGLGGLAPPPRGPHGEPGGPEVDAGRLPPHARRLLDAPERPAQLPKCENLLPFVVAQDVGHAGERDHSPSRRVNVLSAYSLWPVLRCRPMAGFGCRPRYSVSVAG